MPGSSFRLLRPVLAWVVIGLIAQFHAAAQETLSHMTVGTTIALPPPRMQGSVSLEEALRHRRSVRDFLRLPPSLAQVSQLLWAAQGVTHGDGLRTVPSAGALYPLEVYLVAGDGPDLPAGIYRYVPPLHGLRSIRSGDCRSELATAALQQDWLTDSAMILALSAVEERTSRKYGSRANRYILLEAGHAAQNVLLQAVALGLGATPVGAFDDERVARVLDFPNNEQALYLVPIGKPR